MAGLRGWLMATGLMLMVGVGAPAVAEDGMTASEPDAAHTPQGFINVDVSSGNETLGYMFAVKRELSRDYPRPALLARIGGTVRLDCDWDASGAVSDCRIESERPAGKGLGEAAVAIAKANGYVYARKTMASGSGIKVTLNFQVVPSPCEIADTLMKSPVLKCTRFLSIRELMGRYPEQAIDREIEGSAVVDCTVKDEGGHLGCTIVSETPANVGFGPASVATVSDFLLVAPKTAGTPITGATVQLKLGYRLF